MLTHSQTLKLVCPHCHTLNRVPEDRLRDSPVCGRCKQPLAPAATIHLNDTNFDSFILRSELPVLVDFWASWCGPCRMMAPEFERAAAMLQGKMILAKLDTEQSPGSASRYSITGIPTLVLIHRGREVARQSGAAKAVQIAQWAQSAVR